MGYRRGRVQEGYFDEKRATVRMAELIAEHDRETRDRGGRAGAPRASASHSASWRRSGWSTSARARRQAVHLERLPLHPRRARSAAPPRQGQEPRHPHDRVRRSPRGEDHHTGGLCVPAQTGHRGRLAPFCQREPPGALRDLWLRLPRRHPRFAVKPRGQHDQAPRTPSSRARLLRAGGGGDDRLRSRRRVTPWSTAGQPGRRRDRLARTRGRTGRRAVPSRRLHRPAPRRADRAALGGRRPRQAADGRPPRRVRWRGGADQELAGTLLPLADPAAEALERLRARGDYTRREDYIFCSASADDSIPRPSAAGSRLRATPPDYVRCAFTPFATRPAA